MDASRLMDIIGALTYLALAATAVWGIFCVVLLVRRIDKKRFRTPENESLFFNALRDRLQLGEYDEALKVCNSPAYWDRAVARLAALAIENRHEDMPKIRRLIVERFEREVLADLEYRLSWVQTMIKSAPMLGLLGTVEGMIGAFGKLSAAQIVEPTKLAGDISLALYTTFIGLMIAIPLIICVALVNVRTRRLETSVEDGVARFLEDFSARAAPAERRRPAEMVPPRG